MTLVSIVLLNWNGNIQVRRCLESVFVQTHRPLEVIVVDNGSSDGSAEMIESEYGNLLSRFIKNATNLGYARGMNQGIEASTGEFVIPLNQDVVLDSEFVATCVHRMLQDRDIGAIGGRVFTWVNNDLTNRVRKGEGELTFLRKRFQGGSLPGGDDEELVFRPNGSFPFLRRAMLDDLFRVSKHYYDEDFVTGWEDTDLFLRMQLRGWHAVFLPSAFGWHMGSGSVGGNAKLVDKPFDYQVRVLRNRYFTMMKNLPIETLIWLGPHLILTELALFPYFFIKSPKTAIALLLARYHFLRAFPKVMKKRKQIQSNRVVSPKYINQFFLNSKLCRVD